MVFRSPSPPLQKQLAFANLDFMAKTNPFFIDPEDAPSKQAILKAALRLFTRKGICETSIRDIADEAGYTNPALFKFFNGKDALALYLFERCYHRFAVELFTVSRTKDTPENVLRRVVQRTCELIDESPEAFLYMQDNLRLFWPQMPPTTREFSMIGQLQRLVEACKTSKFARDDIDTNIAVSAIAGLSIQFGRLLYFGEIKGKALDWVKQLEDTVIAMIRK